MILTCYADESGTHDAAKAFVLGAALATDNQWRAYASKMDRMRDQFGFSVFHAVDFKHERGDFKGWPPEKYADFLAAFADAGSRLVEVTTIWERKDEYKEFYKKTKDDPQKLQVDTEYGLAFRPLVMHMVSVVAEKFANHPKRDQIKLHFVLEEGGRGINDCKRIYPLLKTEIENLGFHCLGDLSFAPKSACELWLADMQAHTGFAMEEDGFEPKAATGEPSPKEAKLTGVNYLRFTPEAFEMEKARLIELLERRTNRGK